MIRKFLKLSHRRRCILIKAFFCTLICRMIMKHISFKKYKFLLGKSGVESCSGELNNDAHRIINEVKWAVVTSAKYSPWKSECLVKAMTCKVLLSKFNLHSTIYLGINRQKDGDLSAHAWIRCGNVFVTGGDGSEYGVVGKFSN